MTIPTAPPLLPMPIAASGDTRTIPEQTPTGTNQLSYQSGFPPITSSPLAAGGIPPQREDFNAALNLLSQHAFFQQSGGVYTWSSALNYLKGGIIYGLDGILYQALQNSGPDFGGAQPTSNGLFWINRKGQAPLISTGSILDFAVTSMQSGVPYMFRSTMTDLPDAGNGIAWKIEYPYGDGSFYGDFVLEYINYGTTGVATYRNKYDAGAWKGWRRVDSGGAFPSSIYVDFAANPPPNIETEITMPFTGWVFAMMKTNNQSTSPTFFRVQNATNLIGNGMYIPAITNSLNNILSVPAAIGDKVKLTFDASNATLVSFRAYKSIGSA